MKLLRVFISLVQKEFAAERAALRDYLRGDPLLLRFFDAFIFEEVPGAVLSAIDAEIAALEQRLAKTRALKRGMMQELLTGRIRLV